jgi:hypothetical protein
MTFVILCIIKRANQFLGQQGQQFFTRKKLWGVGWLPLKALKLFEIVALVALR